MGAQERSRERRSSTDEDALAKDLDDAQQKRNRRDQVRFADEELSGTFRIPRT